jgi:hypothetical protein
MRTTSRSFSLLALTILALSAALPTGALAIVNGSFEPSAPTGPYFALPGGSTAIPGWVTTDTGVEWFRPADFGSGPAADGLYCVDLANYTYSAGGIRQTIPTTAGVTYEIGFFFGTEFRSGRDGTAEIVVTADAASQTFSITNLGVPIVWEPRTFTFTADDGSASLSFRCLQNANAHFAYIDAVGPATPTAADRTTWGRVKTLYR